jgi:hypothetical protein
MAYHTALRMAPLVVSEDSVFDHEFICDGDDGNVGLCEARFAHSSIQLCQFQISWLAFGFKGEIR